MNPWCPDAGTSEGTRLGEGSSEFVLEGHTGQLTRPYLWPVQTRGQFWSFRSEYQFGLKQPIFSYRLLGDNGGALSVAQKRVGTCRQGSIGSDCGLALEYYGSQELACGWAAQPPLLAGFQGPD